MILDALKKHVQCAEEVLSEPTLDLAPEVETRHLDLKGIDIVCKVGVSLAFYEKVSNWLKGKEGRRLFFIEDSSQRLKSFALQEKALPILNDPCVKIFYLESPIKRDAIAKKVGWLSAFKELLIVGDDWVSLIESYHIAAHAIASDAADFGVGVMRHLKKNLSSPVSSLAGLKGSMKGIPAIICGAGPSLEKNGHLLKEWKGKSLLIAAGSAIHSMDVEPDLAIAFDSHIPVIRKRYFDVPVCIQSRTHPDSLNGVTGASLYFPETHHRFESWLTNSEQYINSGWTAGTAGVAIAAYLGCTEIILIGMDYCYRGEQKYAGQKKSGAAIPLIKAKDAEGKVVWTQRDWLMATKWLTGFAEANPEISCMNATIGGLEIPGFELPCFSLNPVDLRLKEVIAATSSVSLDPTRLVEWKASLKRCHREALTPLGDDEIAQELLLDPLWQIWAPLFERELMADKKPISLEEKMTIQKLLFFNQVIEEHLHD
jgi:uncharacterized Rossmann fold enzyme